MARRYDLSTKNRCSRTISTEHELLPATTMEINNSSLKRIKQSNNDRKRLKVVDDAKFTTTSKSSECSNNRLTSMTSRPSTVVSFEKLIGITEGKSSSTQKVYHQNVTNNSSFCSPSSEINSRCLPVNCNQPDLRTMGPLGVDPSKVSITTKSPSVKNNTVQYTLNSSNQPYQSFSHLHQNQVLQNHQESLIKYSHLQGIPEKPKETQVSPGTSSQSTGNNTLHAALNPQILTNQIFRGFHQPQGNQLSSTSPDHLQRMLLNHRRIISNLQSLCPDFSTNQKCSQGSGQNTPYVVQNPTKLNVTNQFSQIPNSSSIYQDHSEVLLTHKATTNDVSSTPHVDDVNEQSSTEMSTEEGLTSQTLFDQEGQSADSITNIVDFWLGQISDLFDKMNSDFSQTCKMAHDLHESLVQSAETFQCIASISANLRKLKKSKATVETLKVVTVEDRKVAEKKLVEMKEKVKSDVDMAKNKKKYNNKPKRGDDSDESSNDDNNTTKDEDMNKNKNVDEHNDKDKDKNGVKDEEAQKKICGCTRTFVLPPEYDPNDTKWTLKYPKANSRLGLVELVKKSRIYINAIRLAHCKRMSNDSKTLARMLLAEIFSHNALSVCSLTGIRANAYGANGTKYVRPGLDEHARLVILTYVEEHARLQDWGPFDTQSVIKSMRNKIQEMRPKYGQTK